MNAILIAPVVAPLACMIAALLMPRRPRVRAGLAYGAPLAILVSGMVMLGHAEAHGIAVTRVSGLPAGLGISFVADRLASIMIVLTGLVALAAVHFARPELCDRSRGADHLPLFHALLMGVSGAFLTGDLFNLYVWIEVLLLSSFTLVIRRGTKDELVGTLRYLLPSLLSSFVLLVAVGLVYATVGALDMATISRAFATGDARAEAPLIAGLLVTAFGIKAGMFPFFAWIPAAYPVAAPGLAALFAGLLTKVGVYAILRTLTLLFPEASLPGDALPTLLVAAATLTMLSGVQCAAAQHHVRRILSFHIASQIGYMLMGIAIMTPLAVAGTVFYLIHHIVTKTALFLAAGVLHRRHGTEDLPALGGAWNSAPVLGLLFLAPALSLAGVPPFSGFWAKLALLRAGVEEAQWLLVTAAVLTGLLTMFSMTKIWAEAFWKDAPSGTPPPERVPARMHASLAVLSVGSLLIGLAAGPLFALSARAAEELLEPERYRAAVLGSSAEVDR